MQQDGKSRRSLWRLPRVLGAAALATGLLTAGLPATQALASPAAGVTPMYTFTVTATAKAVGHTWTLTLEASKVGTNVQIFTRYKGVSEMYEWTTPIAFDSTAAKELTVTSANHAKYATGKALSPVLSAALAFTPVKSVKHACAKGTDTIYTGKVSGTLTLATGLKKVKIALKFAGKQASTLEVDKACITPVGKPGKIYCSGAAWSLASSTPPVELTGYQTSPTSAWTDNFYAGPAKTGAKWLSRVADIYVNGPAPKVNTAAKQLTIRGLASGAFTGAAVYTYESTFTEQPTTCYVGSKKYTETYTAYEGTKQVSVSKPLQAHALLAGTLPMKPNAGSFSTFKLSAA